MLAKDDVASDVIFKTLADYGIGIKTSRNVKNELGIYAYRRNRKWYWTLDENKIK